jgi:hypothetical protein
VSGGREDVEARIVSRAQTDGAFRQRLLDDATAAIADELGVPLPDGVKVTPLEQREDELVLVLPPSGKIATAELSDDDLEVASGGTTYLPSTAWA